MTYREYMENHDGACINCCQLYRTEDGLYSLLMYDGELLAISSPTIEAIRYDGSLTDSVMSEFAQEVNPFYDLYDGWSDIRIALECMKPTGCANCPRFDQCGLMGEEIGGSKQ